MLGAAEGDVAGGDVPAVILADEFTGRAQHFDLFHAVVRDVQIAGVVEAHAIGLRLQVIAAFMLGQIGEEFALTDFAGHGHFVNVDAIVLALCDVEFFAVRCKDDAIGISEPLVDEQHLARLIDVVDAADRILFAAVAGIAEIETAIGRIERKVIRTEQRLAFELLGGGREHFSIRR